VSWTGRGAPRRSVGKGPASEYTVASRRAWVNDAAAEKHVKAKIVTVFGSSAPQPLSPAYRDAYELGRGIAAAGWILCNGGYGGTMEAAAKGAVEAGGHTIGVTCSAQRLGRFVAPRTVAG
jgi:hypothetical protein